MEEKYNGWTNRDTWLVMLWLMNEEPNYRYVCHLKDGIGSNKKLAELTEEELKSRLKSCHYGDKVIWDNVNMTEIKDALLED